MVQGGAPRGSMKGKGGESIYGAPFEDEINPNLTFDKRGLLAMANKGPNTNTSQFFISFKEAPHLNSTATIFGKLIHGWETLDEMENAEVDAKNRPVLNQIHFSLTIFCYILDQRDIYSENHNTRE